MNWEQHFRAMRSGRPSPYQLQQCGFGMIGNAYSIAELIDLVAAKDVTIANIDKLLAEVESRPLDLGDIVSRVNALHARYQAARANAESAITMARLNFLTPNTMLAADAEYKAILAACNPKWESHSWSPGDGSIEDINDTLMKMGATGATASPIPQPRSGTDFDLNQYHTASAITTMAEGAAKGAGNLLGQGASGLLGRLDWSTIAKIAIIAGVGIVVLPKILAIGPAKLLVR
jgi:hypothetical protein